MMTLQACLWIGAAFQTVTIGCMALVPLKGRLQELFLLKGWEELYRFSTSNLDVCFLSWIKTQLLIAFVLSAGQAGLKAEHFRAIRIRIGTTGALFQTFLILKSVAVAILAPSDIYPTPPKIPGQPVFVGLALMFCSICFAMIATLLDVWIGKEVVRRKEATLLKAAAGSSTDSSLTAPLLAVTVGSDASRPAPSSTPPSGSSAYAANSEKEKEKKEKVKFNSKTLRQLLWYSAHEWHIILVAFSAGAIAALAQALIPYWTGQVIDFASIEPDMARFRSSTIKLLLCALVCAIFSGIRGGLFTVVGTKLNVRIRRLLFHSLLTLEIGFFDTTKSGDITSRLTADTTTASDQVCLNLNILLRSATQAAMVLAFMFYASWRLTIITFILVPLILAISSVYGAYFSELSKKVQSELADANAAAQEVLSTMTTVKAHAAQDSAEAIYADKLLEYYRLNVREALAYASYASITTFLPNVVAAVVLYYGGQLVLRGQMSPGALVSFMLYHQSLSAAFSMIGDVFAYLTQAIGAADKVIELINRKPQVDQGGTLIPPEGLVGRVELKSVVFSYPSRPDVRVLDGLSLVAEPGETVALVGVSGGGKSSIVKLLERFYLPLSGQVMIDGRDIGTYDAKWLRRQVALVSQEPTLYARSIRRNIIFGLESADGMSDPPSQAEIEAAAQQANAHDFINAFPEGYDTDCGERGVQMSGGQKQRIAIARALVRKPRILLLDEATSALDADSEAVVQDALDRLMSNRTTLVIAHRLSTIQGADRIIVIGNGVVQESGTHAELLEAGGAYATLVQRQLNRSHSSVVSLKSLTPIPSASNLASLPYA